MNSFWKRGLALLFALALIFSLALPVYAEDAEDGEPTLTLTERAGEDGSGAVKRIGGDEEQETQAPAYREICVSQKGSDETGDGSEAKPYASLSRAAKAANALPEQPVFVILLTGLEAKETARFTGRNVTIMAVSGVLTVLRAEGFAAEKKADGTVYNPAMIELCSPEGSKLPAGTLTLIGVILDDAGRSEGSVFPQPAPESAPTEEAPAEPQEEAPVEAQEEAFAEELLPPAETAAAPAAAEAAEETSDDPAREKQPAGEPEQALHSEQVQDAIVSVGDGGHLVLSTGSELRNFGGLSAVRLGEGSSLSLEADSAIRDTLPMENALPAVSAPASARIETFPGAKLDERPLPGPTAELNDILPGSDDTEGGFSSIEFTADPETITRLKDSTWLQYPVNYTLSFSMSERLAGVIEGAQSLISDSEGTVTLHLDARLSPDLSSCSFTSSVFELDGDPTFDEESHTLTASFKLKEDWASHLDALTEPMRFSCQTSLSFTDFTPSTETEDQYLESSGEVSLSLTASNRTIGPYSSSAKTAKTKMLGLGNATLVYDPNGGVGGPGQETGVSPQKDYPLKTQPAPTHEALDGVPVVFLGWTQTKDEKIYAMGDEKPETISSVAIPGIVELSDLIDNTVTVYAVYGTDLNADGIPDVEQRLATLRFDPNGGENAPDPIVHVVGSSESGDLGVNIPEQEPNRDYYTFLGWGETADAAKTDKLYKYDAEKESRRDIAVTKDTTLYAVWEQNYRINYDANGGQNAPAATVLKTQTKTGTDSTGNPIYTGQAQITSGVPTRNGYTFQGWATSRVGSAAYFAGDQVEISGGNVTLYAVWTRNASGSTTNGSTNGGSGAPKTGDPGTGLYAALLGLSSLGLTAVLTVSRKARKV